MKWIRPRGTHKQALIASRLLLLLFPFLAAPAFSAIGDNAPPIPASYVTGHPRLGAPSNAWLLSLWNGGSLPPRYSAAAGSASTGFDPSCIRQTCSGTSFRYLLLSYLASRAAGVPNSVWKSKLVAIASLGGTWGQLLLSDDTATANSSVCTTNCTVTDTTVNFQTGCGGASCNGKYLTVLGLRYVIESVPDANHVVVHKFSIGQPYPFPNGTGLKIRVFGTLYDTGETSYYHAMLYDWLYSDLSAQQQADMQASLANLCLQFENDYVTSRYSPYNDLFYMGQNGWSGKLGMFAAAIAIYPDMGSTGLQHLKWSTDVLLNVMLPAWKHVMSTGGWHESWNDYIESNSNVTLKAYIVGALLPWANASGNMPGFFTVDNPWLKNFAYLTMYLAKPDFNLEKLGAVSNTNFSGEYHLCSIGASMGALNGLAEIYNDPVLRGWARLVNGECSAGPDGNEPSAWPYYTPDKNANASLDRSSLPLCHNFTGWGTIVCRSGWTEDDTWMSFRYGDDFWSHQHFDSGSFTLFNRGSLAIDSGVYHAGSYARHYVKYASQTIAHNTLVIKDPADNYPGELSQIKTSISANTICENVANDGGQRRVGSGWQSYFTTGTCGGPVTNTAINSPDNVAAWLRGFPYFHYGTLAAYALSPDENAPKYVYMVADLTNAYNSAGLSPSVSNRTQRVARFLRHMVFIPRGHAGYLIVYDQVTSTSATFVKKWLLHSINQPVITGSKYVIQRTENVTSKPYSGIWPGGFMANVLAHSPDRVHYQYAGQLTGFAVTLPNYAGAPSISAVGGHGHEFDDGTGTNQNECQYSIQCSDAGDPWGLGDSNAGCPVGFICPTSATGGQEAGAWRLEEQPYNNGSNTQDWFLNVMLASTAGDTNVPVSVVVPSNLAPGMVGATWSDANNTYTITFPQTGVGGHITISGIVDEDLLNRAQPLPSQIVISSGDTQSGVAGSSLPSPLVVVAKNSAGDPVPNATVYFAISQGNGQLSSAWATTNNLGVASTSLTLGSGPAGSVTTVMAYINGVTPVSFRATLSGGSGTSATLSSLSCSPTSLNSGGATTCTVGLSQPAGSGGETILLTSNSQALTVPLSVMVPGGSSTAIFAVTAGSISGAQTAVVTATLNGSSQTASLSLLFSNATLTLNSVSCSPTVLSAGMTSTCTVTLSQAAGSGGVTVTLSSSTPLVTFSGSLVVPAGSSRASFTATAGSISVGQTAVVTATLSGVSQIASMALLAPQVAGGIPIPVQSWTMVPTHGFPVQTVGFEKLIYAPSPVKKAVMLGNYHMLGSEPNQSLIAYDFEANRWSVLNIGASFHSESMPDSGHPVGGFNYDPSLQSFIYYCCGSGSNQPENVFYTWWFDPVGQVGRSKEASPKPGYIFQEGAAFDTLHSTYVLHGGGSLVGTWTYNPSANLYAQQSPRGTAPNPSVDLPSMTYNTTDHKVYLFGGQTSYPNGFTNELFAYDVSTNTWTQLNPGGAKPSPRWRCGFAYDSTNNIFLLYGGQDSTRVYNDTWVYSPSANTWTQLSPLQSPPVGIVGSFETLAYDSDHNVFIMVVAGKNGYADGNWSAYSAQTWLFRYAGAGPNAGTVQTSFQPTSGALNQNFDAWAKEPSLASSGNVLYAAWVETGRPFDTNNSTWFHVYADSRTSGAWTKLGGSPASLDSEFGSYSESHSPSITVVAGKPWVSWYKWNNAGNLWALWAKSWSGTSWQGGKVGTVGSVPNKAYQGRSQMADVAGVPHIAFLEVDKSFYPQRTFVYVKYWNGTQWVLKGTGAVNINSSSTTIAGSVSITSDGTNPFVAWTEYTTNSNMQSQTPAQVYVARWNGTQWIEMGGSLNNNVNASADDASITYVGGQPYVAWTEKLVSGNSQLFVKTFNGAGWALVGSGARNKDTDTGWAFRPSLVADSVSNSLYVGWVEQQALGKHAQTYVSKFASGVWTALGGSLNADTTLGSAERVSLTMVGGQPAAAWGEVNFGSMRQVYVKQWNGSSWDLLTGTAATGSKSCDLNSDGAVNILDVQLAINQALGTKPCTTADLQNTGQCSVTDVQRVINASLGLICVIGK